MLCRVRLRAFCDRNFRKFFAARKIVRSKSREIVPKSMPMDVSNGAFTPPLTVATATATATGCNGNGEPYIFFIVYNLIIHKQNINSMLETVIA